MAGALTRDDVYFFENIVFKVGTCLFKVPRYQFEHNSEIFQSAFSLPPREQPEGLDDKTPFEIEGVLEVDFRNFLTALYPLNRNSTLSKEQWISTLKLSNMWGFCALRHEAITSLLSTDMKPAEKIQFGKMYSVGAFFRQGCIEFIQQPNLISEADAHEIGYEVAFHLGTIREMKMSNSVYLHTMEKALQKVLQEIDQADKQFGPQVHLPDNQQPLCGPTSVSYSNGGGFGSFSGAKTKRVVF
ncbi:hypothetical protein BDZ97DRAFT_1866910 [Flammula alnicola]|nr:hypothetical protein BDZ97DRAFT_1866910 [Flammula alnicola]